ncbi:hypothetical protein K1T71_014647 [Dendrolimus kikuchii]|uniref:Uncharacterized protein n=1 Tax=Dendrolimus kikuchii TaxID=765133 RepID=A0ACC1CEN8_9NEOP|nr:hypothetical protein K1T71_014647 [Dendrolimus kikuchii]
MRKQCCMSLLTARCGANTDPAACMALDEEFSAQLEEQERLAANARLPPPPPTMPQHSSTLHSSRTSLASSHYD